MDRDTVMLFAIINLLNRFEVDIYSSETSNIITKENIVFLDKYLQDIEEDESDNITDKKLLDSALVILKEMINKLRRN